MGARRGSRACASALLGASLPAAGWSVTQAGPQRRERRAQAGELEVVGLEREARAVVAVRGQQGDISGAEVGDDKPPEELAVAVEEECARLVAGNAER